MVPKWKKWLSYLWEWHIESRPSATNPHLYVSLRKGEYQLCTDKAIYSWGTRYDNFVKAFRTVEFDQLPGREALVLGFGLGSVPIILERQLHQTFHYTGVEIDEAVIYLASKYTLPDLQSPVQLICADAGTYVATTSQSFDLIAMDVFLSDQVPVAFNQLSFLQRLHDLLTPGGILFFNRLSLSIDDQKKARTYFDHTFRAVFPNGQLLDADGNYVLIGTRF